MAIKTHKVTLSLDNPRVIQSGINVQSFDKQSIQISIELTKNDEVFQVPSDATIRVSLLKLARQEQKIIVDVPNTNRESVDWIVPDYLDGYQGTVRVGVYLVSGTENVDLGYFTILSNVSDIDKMADEFTDNVFQGWEQIEADLNELNLTIAQTKLDLAEDLTQVDNTIANINALASDFTADVATKQADVTSKYNAFDTDITEANQTIDDILGLADDVQQVSAQVAEKVQNFKIKNEVVNGDFSQGLTGWSFTSSQYSSIDVDRFGYPVLKEDYSNTTANTIEQNVVAITSDKLYISYRGFIDDVVGGTVAIRFRINNYMTATNGTDLFQSEKGLWKFNSVVVTDKVNGIRIRLSPYQYTGTIFLKDISIINLTQTFGAGNEPTKEEMDELMKVIPNGWWDGELSLTQKQFITWQLNLIRKNTNAIIALGGTIV